VGFGEDWSEASGGMSGVDDCGGVGEGKMKEALQETGWEGKVARIFHL